MSYISKHLESLMTRSDSVQKSKTTSSQYFEIQGVIIRISDHFSTRTKVSIDIVNPINMSTVYLVKVKEGVQIMYFKLSEIKVFIKNYLLLESIKKSSVSVKESVRSNDMVKSGEIIYSSLSQWCPCAFYLSKGYRYYTLLSPASKKFLKLHMVGKKYKDILNFLNDLSKDDLCPNVETLNEYFKQ